VWIVKSDDAGAAATEQRPRHGCTDQPFARLATRGPQMAERGTIGPSLEERPTTWCRHSTAPFLGVVLAVVMLAALLLAGAFAYPPAAAQAPGVPPGLQPPVQGWLKEREKDLIELNDALVPLVQKRLGDPATARDACTRLARVTRALSARGPVPGPRPEIDATARAGLEKFGQAAAACLAGDVPTAERLVGEGLVERITAQDRLDALLEGE
jgi:hypothetical protein